MRYQHHVSCITSPKCHCVTFVLDLFRSSHPCRPPSRWAPVPKKILRVGLSLSQPCHGQKMVCMEKSAIRLWESVCDIHFRAWNDDRPQVWYITDIIHLLTLAHMWGFRPQNIFPVWPPMLTFLDREEKLGRTGIFKDCVPYDGIQKMVPKIW